MRNESMNTWNVYQYNKEKQCNEIFHLFVAKSLRGMLVYWLHKRSWWKLYCTLCEEKSKWNCLQKAWSILDFFFFLRLHASLLLRCHFFFLQLLISSVSNALRDWFDIVSFHSHSIGAIKEWTIWKGIVAKLKKIKVLSMNLWEKWNNAICETIVFFWINSNLLRIFFCFITNMSGMTLHQNLLNLIQVNENLSYLFYTVLNLYDYPWLFKTQI